MQFSFFNANDLKLFSALVVAVFLGIPYWKKSIAARSGHNKPAENKEGK